ncbi:hypothetical protein [Candidatus Sarmatiella mevalonica]|uniref:hypothetical protein n=1 Tax=Candidatus Sarmatiella mevalonica TaxID=2770581 RepID=UPI0019211442|nr:hypothetical protein [Candidatus Sarmatiella mevalonica]
MLFKQYTALLLCAFLLFGCSNPNLHTDKTIKNGKKLPLYNTKYIELAKRNIAQNRINQEEEEQIDEIEKIISSKDLHKQMYIAMIKKEGEMARQETSSQKNKKQKSGAKQLKQANETIDASTNQEEQLRKELEELRAMLVQTREELMKHQQPTAEINENISESLERTSVSKNSEKSMLTHDVDESKGSCSKCNTDSV